MLFCRAPSARFRIAAFAYLWLGSLSDSLYCSVGLFGGIAGDFVSGQSIAAAICCASSEPGISGKGDF